MEIKKGSIVQLKSGGPKMTVEGFQWNPMKGKYDEDKVICSWFVKYDKKQDTFERAALELIE